MMKSLTVKAGVLAALSQLDGRDFTVDDLTETYRKSLECPHQSKKAARQFVYRNMLKLIESGDLTRVVVDGGWPRYRIISQLPTGLQPAPPTPATVIAHTPNTSETKNNPRQSLQDRLNQHKLEMLTVMGETEEYDAICSEIPELRNEVQPLYNQSRDKCSKLLGRVKALESLLARETGLAQ